MDNMLLGYTVSFSSTWTQWILCILLNGICFPYRPAVARTFQFYYYLRYTAGRPSHMG